MASMGDKFERNANAINNLSKTKIYNTGEVEISPRLKRKMHEI